MTTGLGRRVIKLGGGHLRNTSADGSFRKTHGMALSIPYPAISRPYKGNVTEEQEGTLTPGPSECHGAVSSSIVTPTGTLPSTNVLDWRTKTGVCGCFRQADARPKITQLHVIMTNLGRTPSKQIGAVPGRCSLRIAYLTTRTSSISTVKN